MDKFHPKHPSWVNTGTQWQDKLREKLSDFPWSDQINISSQQLSFYPDVTFLIVKDPTWEPANAFVYVLEHEGDLTVLDGTSPPIHALNGAGLLRVDRETVIDYLRFFCFFVRGEDGPFYIATAPDAPYLPDTTRFGASETYSETQEVFRKIHQSIRTFGRSNEGNWRMSATVYYSNAVFVSDFTVQPSGMIEMKDDNPLMSDLPLRIDAPLRPGRTRKTTIH